MFGAAELATASNKNVVTISEILSEKLKSGFLKYYEYLHPNMRTHRERERNDTLIKCPVERYPQSPMTAPGAGSLPTHRTTTTWCVSLSSNTLHPYPTSVLQYRWVSWKKTHERRLKHTLEHDLHLFLPQWATANARLPGAFLGSEKKTNPLTHSKIWSFHPN